MTICSFRSVLNDGTAVWALDEIAQSQLIVGIHEYGIDPEPRFTRPPYRSQPYPDRGRGSPGICRCN